MKRATIAIFLLIFAVHCDRPFGQAPTPTSSASGARVHASPTTPAKALCTFPVAGTDAQGNGTGYFLTVPTAAKTTPTVQFVQSGLLIQTVDKPILTGGPNGGVYDRALGRWLPAEWSALSPDGTHYAYSAGRPGGDNQLHIVDASTGNDQVVASSGQYYPFEYRVDGLYLAQRNAGSGLWSGSNLFLIDPVTNAIRLIHSSSRTEFWTFISGGFAYGADINPSDPNPVGSGEAPDELIRLDLASGDVVRFQYHPGQVVSWIATTASQQIASIGSSGFQFIDAAGNATSVTGTPGDASEIFTDSEHTWLLAGDPRSAVASPRNTSLYLLLNGQFVHEMDFQLDQNDVLAGACL